MEAANNMEYKNTKTGATFSSPCVVSGGNWVLVTKEKEPVKESEEVVEAEVVETVEEEVEEAVEEEDAEDAPTLDGLAGITIKQIKQELDAFGIEYKSNAKKEELYLLMINGK